MSTRNMGYDFPDPILALDMDGVLAATKATVFDEMGVDEDPETLPSWHYPVEKYGPDRFFGAFDTVWSDRWRDVQPAEDSLAGTVSELDTVFEVHVVTTQPWNDDVTAGKKCWLDYHGIDYDKFVTVPRSQSKATLGYTTYLDDKPSLPKEVNQRMGGKVYLRDHSYNEDALGDYTRVPSVRGMLNYFIFGTFEGPGQVTHHE